MFFSQNSDIFWSATLSVRAMPADFIIRLAKISANYSFQNNWIQLLRERDDDVEKSNRLDYTYFILLIIQSIVEYIL